MYSVVTRNTVDLNGSPKIVAEAGGSLLRKQTVKTFFKLSKLARFTLYEITSKIMSTILLKQIRLYA